MRLTGPVSKLSSSVDAFRAAFQSLLDNPSMNRPSYVRVLLALASGLTLALSFPNFNLSLLAWISVGLLVLACAGARPVVAILCGMLSALVFFPLSLTWMDVVMRQYGDVGVWTSAGILGLVGVAGGIIFAVFYFGSGARLAERIIVRMLAGPISLGGRRIPAR